MTKSLGSIIGVSSPHNEQNVAAVGTKISGMIEEDGDVALTGKQDDINLPSGREISGMTTVHQR